MLPKKERLTTFDFKGLRPKTIFRGFLVDIAVYKTTETSSRFACVIQKKRVKKAVDRNTIKRKVYAILKESKPKLSHLVIIYPKKETLTTPSTKIQSEILQGFATLQ
jgi:ribonuclease P protein component